MKIIIKEETKNKLLFSAEGAGHAIAGVIKDELWEDAATTGAGYSVSHPLVGVPEFVIETNGKKAGKKIVHDALGRVQKKLSSLEAEVKSMKL